MGWLVIWGWGGIEGRGGLPLFYVFGVMSLVLIGFALGYVWACWRLSRRCCSVDIILEVACIS